MEFDETLIELLDTGIMLFLKDIVLDSLFCIEEKGHLCSTSRLLNSISGILNFLLTAKKLRFY